jgi:hypothetical protein
MAVALTCIDHIRAHNSGLQVESQRGFISTASRSVTGRMSRGVRELKLKKQISHRADVGHETALIFEWNNRKGPGASNESALQPVVCV